MFKKKVMRNDRVRRINGGFSYIPHRFITDGFLMSLTQNEFIVYMFLVLVSDRYGLSFYSYDAICSLLHLTRNQYILARNGLMEKDLIDFNGTLFQVLELPPKPLQISTTSQDPATVAEIIHKALKEDNND